MSKKRKRDQNDVDTATEQVPKPPSTKDPVVATSVQTPTKSAKTKGQSRQERSERKSKKQKKTKEQLLPEAQATENPAGSDLAAENAADDDQAGDGQIDSAEKLAKRAKKARKAKKSASDENDGGKDSKSESRFVVFVGNLPFDATLAQVEQHFCKLAPSSIRFSTDKATGKGKGFAFVEFDAFDKMETCLKLYHHSIFGAGVADDHAKTQDEARGKKTKGRRINVELTAGGGGKKSQSRITKIQAKNQKLEEERARRRLKAKSDHDKAAAKKSETPATGANASEGSQKPKDDRGAIHPSRLSRVSH